MTTAPVNGHQQRVDTPKDVKPHRWALASWARAYRRIARPWTVTRHVRRFCQPFSIEGQENLDRLQNPALIIANHASHFDTAVVLALLPNHIYNRTAIVAAADRMYRERIKGAWHSLRYNAFPITRGGGSEALSYSQWLLTNGWSLLIFPEGKRTRTGELLPFHPGAAILALSQRIPVLPMYIKGTADVLPPGVKYSRPAPVRVRVGEQIWFDQGTGVAEAKQAMEDAVAALADLYIPQPPVNTVELALAQEREAAGALIR
ncbi:MAG TPA: lysophospholipid acyltransferase family protein [Dehalococcoidia bacterium]|jgi:1-acyl-sn-glycerol-3-phosphate acyltransferase|nr:lysophospholipid acyltransferase family protein [Dehalococcoidia bacterium]